MSVALHTHYVKGARSPRTYWGFAVAPLVLYLLAFFAWPLLLVLKESFFSPSFTLSHYEVALFHPVYVKVLSITLSIALETTIICLILAYPVAFLLQNTRGPLSIYLIGLILVPFWVSILIRSYALIIILGNHGIINDLLLKIGLTSHPIKLVYNNTGVLIGMVYALLPYMVLTIFGVMSKIDARLVPAAQSLGANGFYTFRKIYFPLSMPGVSAGLVLVFVQAVGYFVTPALLGGFRTSMMAMVIESQITKTLDWGLASALTVILLVAIVVIIAIALRFVDAGALGFPAHRRRHVPDDTNKSGVATSGWSVVDSSGRDAGLLLSATPGSPDKSRKWRSDSNIQFRKPRRSKAVLAVWTFSSAVFLFLLLPVIVIILLSFDNASFLRFPPHVFGFRWYKEFFYGQGWISSSILSLKVAITVTLVSLALGTLAAIGLNRGHFRGKSVVLVLVVSPMIVPVIVIALSLYLFYLKLGLIGTFAGLVLGHTVLAVPFVVILVGAGLRGFDVRLEHAALTLGASRVYAWRRVLIPGIAPSLFAAGLFAFLISFDEVVIAIFVAGYFTPTLPKKIWDTVTLNLDPTIAAVATILVAAATVIVSVAAYAQRKSARKSADAV